MINYDSMMKNYIFDIYMERKPESNYKMWIIDINPWIPVCIDSLLFSWESLENNHMLNLIDGPEFRIVTDSKLISA
jgi:hypothetical protein